MNCKFRVHIHIETESDLKEELAELAFIAIGMREWQKKWEKEFGAHNKDAKKQWEAKMDAWINKNKIVYDAD